MTTDLLYSPLNAIHLKEKATMVPFAGWSMPIQYPQGVRHEHNAVRQTSGLFDVSHMGLVVIYGDDAEHTIQNLITNDISTLIDGSSLYTVFCNESGGIIDDCIVYRENNKRYLIILNAANHHKDTEWIKNHLLMDTAFLDLSKDTALIALQGPEAVSLISDLSKDNLQELQRFHFKKALINDLSCTIARTGYTGEDGFEIICNNETSIALWQLLQTNGATPCGLAARDTLRLEAKLCLYGNDIDETTTPYEACLGWLVKPNASDFIGKESLIAQKKQGISKKLVGFVMNDRGIPRQGYPILSCENKPIGKVTSGNAFITQGGAIGMGYVASEHAIIDHDILIDCRGKYISATIVQGSFYSRS